MNDKARDKPEAQTTAAWGSDAIAELLRALEIPYIALTPGASFRGLHDSLVNHLGNTRPEILLCIHEETAVALAHGYARVTGRPLAVALHANVGLMHATMAIFNAWCDRIPMLLLGGVGPLDAMKRRPWVDWIRASSDPADFTRRVALAERIGAVVLTDIKTGATFPTTHALHPFPPSLYVTGDAARLVVEADVILSLDWIDLGGTLRQACSGELPR